VAEMKTPDTAGTPGTSGMDRVHDALTLPGGMDIILAQVDGITRGRTAQCCRPEGRRRGCKWMALDDWWGDDSHKGSYSSSSRVDGEGRRSKMAERAAWSETACSLREDRTHQEGAQLGYRRVRGRRGHRVGMSCYGARAPYLQTVVRGRPVEN